MKIYIEKFAELPASDIKIIEDFISTETATKFNLFQIQRILNYITDSEFNNCLCGDYSDEMKKYHKILQQTTNYAKKRA